MLIVLISNDSLIHSRVFTRLFWRERKRRKPLLGHVVERSS